MLYPLLRNIKRIDRIIFFVILFINYTPFVYSQTNIDQATIETNRSKLEKLREKLRVQPEKTPFNIEKKEISDDTPFYIEKINLTGMNAFEPKTFYFIIEKYENKEESLKKLGKLSEEIEKEYLKRGLIAACFLPPQEIKQKTVTLQIVEAKMGKLEIKEHKYFNKNRLNYYWGIKQNEMLYYDKLAQSLKLMNKNPDREVKATLHAGEKPQTTDILLNVNTQFPLHATYSFDREGVPSSGRQKQGFGFRHNNLLGLDDTFLGEYNLGKHFNSISQYHSIPITKAGTSLLYGYNYNKSFPKGDLESYGIDSRSKNSNVLIYQDIFNKEEYLGEIHGGFDFKDKTTKLNTGTLNRDRLRTLRIGSGFAFTQDQSATNLNLEISQGLNMFGARRKNSLSSRGAKNVFSRLNLGGEYKRRLFADLQANLKLAGQIASTKLTPQEEFSLGGIDSVRGYPGGDYLADTACQANFDLLLPAFFIPNSIMIPYDANKLRDNITPLLFFDQGYGKRRGALTTEDKDVSLTSVGAGLRIKLFNQLAVRLEWGFPIGRKRITEGGNSQFHFSVVFEDKIPREVERIKKLREENKIP